MIIAVLVVLLLLGYYKAVLFTKVDNIKLTDEQKEAKLNSILNTYHALRNKLITEKTEVFKTQEDNKLKVENLFPESVVKIYYNNEHDSFVLIKKDTVYFERGNPTSNYYIIIDDEEYKISENLYLNHYKTSYTFICNL